MPCFAGINGPRLSRKVFVLNDYTAKYVVLEFGVLEYTAKYVVL